MAKKFTPLFVILCVLSFFTNGQALNPQILLKIHSATTAQLNTTNGVDKGTLIYNSDDSSLYIHSGYTWNATNKSNNWGFLGNAGIGPSNFLGTTKDEVMQIAANSTTTLSIGTRGALGLVNNTGNLFPYADPDAMVAYVQGIKGNSALQFQADGAAFYKPIFFTDDDGNFKMRGSSASTDFFELGSAGTSNKGQLEFVIGDDGDEPIIFNKYNYTTQTYIEMLRLQGTGLNKNVRAGINVAGAVPNSTLQIIGSVSKSIATISSNTTLDESHYTILLSNNSSITLPAASSCLGRIYIIKKLSTGSSTISAYRNNANTATTTIAQGSIQLQSDGSNWYQIN